MMIFSLVILFLQIFAIRSELIKDPTLKPAEPFSASADAEVFKIEMKEGWVTDRDKLINIWFHRTFTQRDEIKQFYDNNFCPVTYYGYYYTFRCPLRWALEDIADDDMSDLYKQSQLSPRGLLAKTVYESISGKLKEVGAIEEVVCGNDKDMKDRITEYYQSTYQDTVDNQLGTFRKDDKDYQQVMKQYCWKGLCQDRKIKPEDADKEAKALRDINPDKDKDGFKKKLIELLDKNCEPDLKLIFEKYRKDKDGISDAVDKAFECKRVKRAYNRLVRYIEDTCKFYADELHAAVDGCGTSSDKINRIILTRCERDLGCILKKYKELHKETFTNRLETDTIERNYLKSIRNLCGRV